MTAEESSELLTRALQLGVFEFGLFCLDFDNFDQLFLDDDPEKSALGFILDRYI